MNHNGIRAQQLIDDALRPMNLQLFAEHAEGADGGAQDGAGEAGTGGETGAGGETSEKRFTQEELDEIINRRFAKLSKDFEKRLDEARKEGEKRGMMSEDERSKADREVAEQKLREREREITRRELRADAVEKLAQKGLPRALADLLDYSDAERCEATLESAEKAFRAAVQEGIDERIRKNGGNPEKGGHRPDPEKMSDAEYYASLRK